MATARFANSRFLGLAQDSLLQTDVYGTQDEDIRTTVLSSINEYTTTLGAAVLKQKSLQRDVVRDNAQERGFDRSIALKRIEGLVLGGKGGISELAAKAQQTILEAIGFDGDYATDIRVAMGETIRIAQGGNITNMRQVSRFLESFTGNSNIMKVFDMEAEAALIGGLLDEASKWHVPEIIDTILKAATDDTTRRRAIRHSINSISIYSSIDMIETYINQGPVVYQALLERVPNFPSLMVANYRFASPVPTPDQYPAKLEQLVRVLDTLKPGWFKSSRTQASYDLTVLRNASASAGKLFATTEPYRTAYLTAKSYPKSKKVEDIIRETWPIAIVV